MFLFFQCFKQHSDGSCITLQKNSLWKAAQSGRFHEWIQLIHLAKVQSKWFSIALCTKASFSSQSITILSLEGTKGQFLKIHKERAVLQGRTFCLVEHLCVELAGNNLLLILWFSPCPPLSSSTRPPRYPWVHHYANLTLWLHACIWH